MENHKNTCESIMLPIEFVSHPNAKRSILEINQLVTPEGLKETAQLSAYFQQVGTDQDSVIIWAQDINLGDLNFTITELRQPSMPPVERKYLLGRLAVSIDSFTTLLHSRFRNEKNRIKKRQITASYVSNGKKFETRFIDSSADVDHESATANIRWFGDPHRITEKTEIDLSALTREVVDYNFEDMINR